MEIVLELPLHRLLHGRQDDILGDLGRWGKLRKVIMHYKISWLRWYLELGYRLYRLILLNLLLCFLIHELCESPVRWNSLW